MKRIYIISIGFFLIFFSVIIIYQSKTQKQNDNNYYIDSIIAAPQNPINYEIDDYTLYLPKDYSISKEDNSLTYVIRNSDVTMTIDKTIKSVTDKYLETNDVKVEYLYTITIDEVDYTIEVWDSLEYEGYYDVYFYDEYQGALAIIPMDNNVNQNLTDLIGILKSITKNQSEGDKQ